MPLITFKEDIINDIKLLETITKESFLVSKMFTSTIEMYDIWELQILWAIDLLHKSL